MILSRTRKSGCFHIENNHLELCDNMCVQTICSHIYSSDARTICQVLVGVISNISDLFAELTIRVSDTDVECDAAI